jgi:hypothetical protein
MSLAWMIMCCEFCLFLSGVFWRLLIRLEAYVLIIGVGIPRRIH